MDNIKPPTSWSAQIALAAGLSFAAFWTLGYFTKPSEGKQKKGGGRGGPPPGAAMQQQAAAIEHKFERLFKTADEMMARSNFADAEASYIECLEIVEEIPDPNIAQMLENVLCARIAVACEKQSKYEEAEKYYLRTISTYEGRTLAPAEVPEYGEVLEKAVELCMTKLNNPAKAVKPLTLWLKLGEDMNNDQIILICSNLLGRIKYTQEKYDEAEAHCKRVIALSERKPGAGPDELALSTMLNLTNIFHKVGKHEENKKLLQDIAAVASRNPPQRAAHLTGSIAEQSFDFGYFQDALVLFQRAIEIYNRLQATEEVHHFENAQAQTLAEIGKVEEAREKMRKLAISLGDATPPLTISQYLQTNDAVVLEEEGQPIHYVKLFIRESKKLPNTALLVAKFDHPEPGHADLESRQMVETDRIINFRIPLPYAKKGYHLAQIDIYADATRTQKLSTHLVLSQSDRDINVPAPAPAPVVVPVVVAAPAPAPELSSSSSSLPSSSPIELPVTITTTTTTTDEVPPAVVAVPISEVAPVVAPVEDTTTTTTTTIETTTTTIESAPVEEN